MESNKKSYLAYLHSDKSSNRGKAKELGLSEKVSDDFIYSLYEVEFNMEVDIETGETWIVGIAGIKLEKPVKS
jgi:hypothetical protein